MDDHSYKRRKYDSPPRQTGAGIGQHHTRQIPGSSIDHFRHSHLNDPRHSSPTDSFLQPQSRENQIAAFGGFEYAASSSYNTAPFQGGEPLPGSRLHYQQNYTAASSRQHPSQATQQDTQPGQLPRIPQQSYEPGIVYNVPQQSQPQSSYDVASDYQPRHSAAIEVLATQFGVPQYFSSDDPGGAGVPTQYLTPQAPPGSYSQPVSGNRSYAPTSFPGAMPEFNPLASAEPLAAQELSREPPKIDDAYNEYHQRLRRTFDYTRSGRVVDASHSLLEISDWLVSNVVELGLSRDEERLHADRLKIWNELNTCWLAICQKQKDMTLAMLEGGVEPESLLTEDSLNKMASELVRLSDKMEQHGLVDYEMGIWEEDIMKVLCECLDLLEQGNRPGSATGDGKHMHKGHGANVPQN